MRRTLRLLGGFAAAALVFLVVGEVLARATGILDRLNGYTRSLFAPGPDLDLPYFLRPDVTVTLRGTTIRTNDLGLRGDAVALEPAPGAHRILLLGDSVVFGQEMTEEETLAHQLQSRLDALGAGPAEVLNAGVPGYDTVSEVRFLEAKGLALRPEAVVVGMSLNDHDVTPQYSPFGLLVRKDLDRRRPDLVDRSEFLTLLRWMVRWTRGELFVQLVAAKEAHHEGPPGAPPAFVRLPKVEESVHDLRLAFYRDPDPAYWQRLRAALATLKQLGDAHRLRVLVAIFPEAYQVGAPHPDLNPQARLLEACADAHLDCLDLQPVFARAGGDLFYDVSHPNATGHAVAAEAIARALTTGR